jgi:hypothetical protein
MRVSEVDPFRSHIGEAEAFEALLENRRRLVAERLAERESERGGGAFLNRVPAVLESRGRVLFFDDEDSVRGQAIAAAREQRVPLIERDLVEDVNDRDRIERSADCIIESDHELDAGNCPYLSRIRFDCNNTPPTSQRGEEAVAGADIEEGRIRRQHVQHTQHRRGQEAEQDVDAVARGAFAENAVQYD